MFSAKYTSARSLAIVETGKGNTVITGVATGDASPAWTTQRAAYNYWPDDASLPGGLPGLPPQIVGDSFDVQSIIIYRRQRRPIWTQPFQVRCEVIHFVLLAFLSWSKHLTLVRSLASNRAEL